MKKPPVVPLAAAVFQVLRSEVIYMYFEVALGMCAGGAYFGSLLADHDVSAVAALPYLHFALCEYLSGLHVLKQRAVSFLVSLLNGCHQSELEGKILEAFFLGGLCESFVHVGPLEILTVCCGCQVLSGIADAFQFLEPEFCVFFLIIRGLQEKLRDLLESVLLCLACKVGVLVSCLRFPGESCLKVLFGLCACAALCSFFLFLFRWR